MACFPEVKSEEELADLVDAHDTAPYWDAMAPVDAASFRLRRRGETAVRVPMSDESLYDLKALAAERGTPLDHLLREWLEERLHEERQAA